MSLDVSYRSLSLRLIFSIDHSTPCLFLYITESSASWLILALSVASQARNYPVASQSQMQTMFEVEMQLLQTLQVEDLTTARKLSFAEFCALCNINVQENRFRLLRNILSCFRVILDEQVLRLCGFTGTTFHELSKQLRRFLSKHRSIETHIFSTDQFYTVYTMDWFNLEALLVLMKNERSVSARTFIHLMRVALEKYRDYELSYERSHVQLLMKENMELSGNRDMQRKELHNVFLELHALQQWVCDINRRYNWTLKNTEAERNRVVDMERRFAQRERERADIERKRAQEEQHKREVLEEQLEKLQWEIGSKLSQTESTAEEEKKTQVRSSICSKTESALDDDECRENSDEQDDVFKTDVHVASEDGPPAPQPPPRADPPPFDAPADDEGGENVYYEESITSIVVCKYRARLHQRHAAHFSICR